MYIESNTFKRVMPAAVIAGLSTLSIASCGSTNKNKVPARTTPTPTPVVLTGAQLVSRIKKESHDARGSNTVPKEFCENNSRNPQQPYSVSHGSVKLIVNSLCQPPIGEPVGMYAHPQFNSQETTTVRDGDVVTAECVSPNGQS